MAFLFTMPFISSYSSFIGPIHLLDPTITITPPGVFRHTLLIIYIAFLEFYYIIFDWSLLPALYYSRLPSNLGRIIVWVWCVFTTCTCEHCGASLKSIPVYKFHVFGDIVPEVMIIIFGFFYLTLLNISSELKQKKWIKLI